MQHKAVVIYREVMQHGIWLCMAQMDGNQSGADKDNSLLLQEQQTLLFSKSKMATANFNQSGTKLRIQDGGAYESQPG